MTTDSAQDEPIRLRPCYGCGALVPDGDGPTHRYLGASPGCWALYGQGLARAADPRFGDPKLLILNSYAVQHPGVPGPQTIQSVVTHLIGLYAVLALGFDDKRIVAALRRAADSSARYHWLEPPATAYPVTILDLLATADSVVHRATARAMAETTWQAWTAHHRQVAAWARAAGVT